MALNHFDNLGNAVMVDVSEKDVTKREAIATGTIYVGSEIINHIKNATIGKGDVLGVARIAGIMAVKKTSDIIPLCHPLSISKAEIDFEMLKEQAIRVKCIVKTEGKTGVEIEALNGVYVALLTIYDMCKAIDKSMHMEDVHLIRKLGGKSGTFSYECKGISEGD